MGGIEVECTVTEIPDVIRVNVLGWPLAIASSLLYFLLFWNSRLYGDASQAVAAIEAI